MSLNVKQVYDANPSTTLGNNDLLYSGKSPYAAGNDSGIKYSDLFTQVQANIGTQNINISNNKAIQPTQALNDTALFQAYDVDDATYRIFMSLRSSNTPRLLMGAPTGGTIILTSFGGTFTIDGATIGGVTPAASTFTTSTITTANITTANITNSIVSGDITLTNGHIKTGTSNPNQIILQAYDVDNTTYKDFITLTAANTPSCSIGAPSGGTLSIDGATLGGNIPIAISQGTASATLYLSGVTDGSSQGVGIIGEVITASTDSASALPLLVSGTIYDINAIGLTAGDWEIYGSLIFSGGVVTATLSQGWFGTASGDVTTGRDLAKNTISSGLSSTAAADLSQAMPTWRLNTNSGITIYLKATSTYTVGAPTAYGTLSARRLR